MWGGGSLIVAQNWEEIKQGEKKKNNFGEDDQPVWFDHKNMNTGYIFHSMNKSEWDEIDTLLEEEDIPQVTPTTMIGGKVKVKTETISKYEAMKKEMWKTDFEQL